MEPVIDEIPYEGNCRDRTDMAGDLQRADFLLYAAVPDECAFGPEIQGQGWQGCLQTFFVDLPVLVDKTMFKSLERDSAVERSGVKIEEGIFFSDKLCKGALAG